MRATMMAAAVGLSLSWAGSASANWPGYNPSANGGCAGCGDGYAAHAGYGYPVAHGGCGASGHGSSWFSLTGVKNSIKGFFARPCPSNAPTWRTELPLGFPSHPYVRSPRDYFMYE